MENKKIDVRNLNEEDLLKVYSLVAKKTEMVQERLKDLFEENKEDDEILEEEKND